MWAILRKILVPIQVILGDFPSTIFTDRSQSIPGHSTRNIEDTAINSRFVSSLSHLIPDKSCHAASFLSGCTQLRFTLGIEFSLTSSRLGPTHLLRLGVLDIANPNKREQTI